MNEVPVRSFKDLEVYQNAYRGMLLVHKEIVPRLPKEEDYDLKDQLRRATKSVPRLIAEGHAKRHQRRGFHKYIDDAMGESNETMVSLEQARDLYPDRLVAGLCTELVDLYDKISRQLHNLALAWEGFGGRSRTTKPDSHYATDQRATGGGANQ